MCVRKNNRTYKVKRNLVSRNAKNVASKTIVQILHPEKNNIYISIHW